ncbi:MAG: sulfite exporter TauE/SafE family protein [Acidobacteria bacterium]|nr:sulfite exporter TauE/SafE family protein [Acidobacteriota bacterium]
MVTALYIPLAALTAFYGFVFLRASAGARPSPIHILTGFVTNFLDTLGIGSFATTTALFKFGAMVPDRLIPGTLNAGHTLPTAFQAFIYITSIAVDARTLILLIAGAVAGAWFGAAAVAGFSRRTVRLCVGGALVIAAATLLMRQFELFPPGGEALGLAGWKLAAAVCGNVVFGAISTLGIGFYAPCMTMVSLMGMNPAAAFPIMMGSSAFLMPAASAQFVQRKAYSAPVALGLALGGLAGVPLAAFVVKSLPLAGLRWLVIGAVLYAAVLTLRSGDKT